MKTSNKTMAMTFAAIALLAYGATAAHAQDLLDVEFDTASQPVQTGFTAIDGSAGSTSVSGTVIGSDANSYTITATPQSTAPANAYGVGTRTGSNAVSNSGSFTYAALYNSDVYSNSSNQTPVSIGLSIGGVVAGQEYALTIYSYDPGVSYGESNTFSATGNTTGTGGTISDYSYPVVNPRNGAQPAAPTSNNEFALTMDVTSTSNVLNIMDAANFESVQVDYARINGFTLDAVDVPEPSTVALMGLAGLAFLAIRRRHILS